MTVEIDGANNIVKTNTISEVTSANGVTVDGLSIKDSKLVTANSVIQTNITDQAINEAKMQISNAPTNGYALTAQSGNTGGMTWASVGGANTPILWAYQGSNQTISANTVTKLTFNNTLLNTGGTFDTSNYRWTPGTTGYYQFNIAIFGRTVSDSGSTFTDLRFNKNGSTQDGGEARFRPSTDTNQTISLSGIVYSDSDDYFEVFLLHQNGSSQATDSNNNLTYWQMYKLIT